MDSFLLSCISFFSHILDVIFAFSVLRFFLNFCVFLIALFFVFRLIRLGRKGQL